MVLQESVHHAVNRQEVDRVPTHFARSPEVGERLSRPSGRLGVALSACLGDDNLAIPFDPWESRCGVSSEDVVEEARLRLRQLAPGASTSLGIHALSRRTRTSGPCWPW